MGDLPNAGIPVALTSKLSQNRRIAGSPERKGGGVGKTNTASGVIARRLILRSRTEREPSMA